MRPIDPTRKIPVGFTLFIKSVTQEINRKGEKFQRVSRSRWLRGKCTTCGKVFERPLKKFQTKTTKGYFCSPVCMWNRGAKHAEFTEFQEAPEPKKEIAIQERFEFPSGTQSVHHWFDHLEPKPIHKPAEAAPRIEPDPLDEPETSDLDADAYTPSE